MCSIDIIVVTGPYCVLEMVGGARVSEMTLPR